MGVAEDAQKLYQLLLFDVEGHNLEDNLYRKQEILYQDKRPVDLVLDENPVDSAPADFVSECDGDIARLVKQDNVSIPPYDSIETWALHYLGHAEVVFPEPTNESEALSYELFAWYYAQFKSSDEARAHVRRVLARVGEMVEASTVKTGRLRAAVEEILPDQQLFEGKSSCLTAQGDGLACTEKDWQVYVGNEKVSSTDSIWHAASILESHMLRRRLSEYFPSGVLKVRAGDFEQNVNCFIPGGSSSFSEIGIKKDALFAQWIVYDKNKSFTEYFSSLEEAVEFLRHQWNGDPLCAARAQGDVIQEALLRHFPATQLVMDLDETEVSCMTAQGTGFKATHTGWSTDAFELYLRHKHVASVDDKEKLLYSYDVYLTSIDKIYGALSKIAPLSEIETVPGMDEIFISMDLSRAQTKGGRISLVLDPRSLRCHAFINNEHIGGYEARPAHLNERLDFFKKTYAAYEMLSQISPSREIEVDGAAGPDTTRLFVMGGVRIDFKYPLVPHESESWSVYLPDENGVPVKPRVVSSLGEVVNFLRKSGYEVDDTIVSKLSVNEEVNEMEVNGLNDRDVFFHRFVLWQDANGVEVEDYPAPISSVSIEVAVHGRNTLSFSLTDEGRLAITSTDGQQIYVYSIVFEDVEGRLHRESEVSSHFRQMWPLVEENLQQRHSAGMPLVEYKGERADLEYVPQGLSEVSPYDLIYQRCEIDADNIVGKIRQGPFAYYSGAQKYERSFAQADYQLWRTTDDGGVDVEGVDVPIVGAGMSIPYWYDNQRSFGADDLSAPIDVKFEDDRIVIEGSEDIFYFYRGKKYRMSEATLGKPSVFIEVNKNGTYERLELDSDEARRVFPAIWDKIQEQQKNTLFLKYDTRPYSPHEYIPIASRWGITPLGPMSFAEMSSYQAELLRQKTAQLKVEETLSEKKTQELSTRRERLRARGEALGWFGRFSAGLRSSFSSGPRL